MFVRSIDCRCVCVLRPRPLGDRTEQSVSLTRHKVLRGHAPHRHSPESNERSTFELDVRAFGGRVFVLEIFYQLSRPLLISGRQPWTPNVPLPTMRYNLELEIEESIARVIFPRIDDSQPAG